MQDVRRFFLDASAWTDAAIAYADLTPALYDLRGIWDESSECAAVPPFDVVMYLKKDCGGRWVNLAHEYFHMLQAKLGAGGSGLRWMFEGSAVYMEEQFVLHQRGFSVEERRQYMVRRAASDVRSISRAMPDASFAEDALENGPHQVGFLAVEWLVERAGEEAILAYYAPHPRGVTDWDTVWAERFAQTFGLTEEEFYTAFGPYLRELLESHASSR